MKHIKHAAYGVAAALISASSALADDAKLLALGSEIYQDTCHACHSSEAKGDDRIAPPIFAAVNHYSDLSERDAFVSAVSSFIVNPTAEASRMPGAIRKFDLMPAQELSEEEAEAVALFLFETDFDMPDWYAKHYEEEHGEAPKTD